MKELFKEIEKKAEEFLKFDPSGHDLNHAIRTFNLSRKISAKEGGDKLVIGAAALLHDVLRPWEKKTGKLHYKGEALEIIKKMLVKVKFPKNKIDSVLHCIETHETYGFAKGKKPKTIEAKILQDADNLDAIGAIGIARCFMCASHHNNPMWVPGEETKKYSPDTVRGSAINHFDEKLLKLKDMMNTKTGKEIAKERHKFMKDFLKRFFKEWEGKL